MSVRLNVIVVQSPRMSQLQIGIVADIVIQLLGRPGIDVAMIASLQPDEEHSTDRLMLSGLENDLAVIDWRSAQQVLTSLASLGLNACHAPHGLDPDVKVKPPGKRRVYIFDLRLGFRAEEVVATVVKLQEQRQVVTVSIAGLARPSMNGKSSLETSIPVDLPNTPLVSIARIKPDLVDQQSEINPQPKSRVDEDADLDTLVDNLNDSHL